jgi:hypothetical protein
MSDLSPKKLRREANISSTDTDAAIMTAKMTVLHRESSSADEECRACFVVSWKVHDIFSKQHDIPDYHGLGYSV